jgi:glutathione peroxidase
MRYYKTGIAIIFTMGIIAFLAEHLSASRAPRQTTESFYDFKVKSLTGEEIDFSRYKGRKVLIVNTASRCGYTPQYKDLEKLHELYSAKLDVLGFPANNFLWQEPGSDNDIAEFCERNYGVDFQMFSKVSVKGKDQHPLFQWLEKKSGKAPSWNFCKYVINEKGEVTGFFPPRVKPTDPEILNLIQP